MGHESLWFSHFAKQHPHLTLINSSAGGIGFQGIPHIPLDQVAASWLKKSYDFDTLIHQKIQRAEMPPNIIGECISEIFTELLESLQRCYDASVTARTELQNMAQGFLGNREAASAPETHAVEQLFAEPAYKHMLEFYHNIFLEMHTLQFRKLTNPKHKFTKRDVGLQKAMIYQACYDAMARISKDTVELLKELLKVPFIVAEKVGDQDDEAKVTKELHSDGSLKSMRKFYINGSLYSDEHFMHGKPHGKQEYFYPDQTKKTVLNYSDGKLHGEIKLYHPNGKLKRELCFIHGKRHGKESIWSETGMLLIEAEFDQDRPKGIARQWNDEGQLIKEVTYTTEAEYVVREWTAEGNLIVEAEGANVDYFDHAFAILGRLIAQLEQALEQSRSLISLIQKAGTESSHDLHAIHIELEAHILRAREFYISLRQEAGVAESIWKGPSSQRHLEHELEELSTVANAQLSKLQEIYSATVQVLIRKGGL